MRNALAVSLFVAACGGGSDNSDKVVINDAPTTKKDAPSNGDGPTGSDSTTVPTCVVNPTLTYTATAQANASADADPATQYVEFIDALNGDATPDLLDIYLVPGAGVFPNSLTNGTYQITGDETDYYKCSACVAVFGDASQAGVTQTYQATSGSITLTSVTGNVTGSISNVQLAAVSLDDDTSTQTPDGSGCTTSIASASFTAPITVSSNFGGKPHAHIRIRRH